MGLLEFLRQWPSRDLAAGVLASALLHGLVVVAILQWRPTAETYAQRQGDGLIVELSEADEPAGAGTPTAPPARPGRPAPAPPAVATPSPPATASRPETARARRPEPSRTAAARPEVPVRDVTPPPREARPAPDPPVPPPAPEPLPAPGPAELPAPVPQTAPVPPRALPPVASPAPVPPAPSPTLAAPAPPPVPVLDGRHPADAPSGAGDPPAEPRAPRVAALPPSPGPSVPDTRSALRRGAGGRGEGRGGVVGEPIPLDSPDPRYNDYLEQVRRKIKANWGFPCVPDEGARRCDYKTTQLVVEFGIAKDGRVPFVVVRSSSGYPIYDDYAVNAIKFSSPFPPVPDSVSATGFPINATFRYVVESSLTNLLR